MVKTKTELLVGHITTNADQEPKQVNDATVPNKSATNKEVELTMRITGKADNSIKDPTNSNRSKVVSTVFSTSLQTPAYLG